MVVFQGSSLLPCPHPQIDLDLFALRRTSFFSVFQSYRIAYWVHTFLSQSRIEIISKKCCPHLLILFVIKSRKDHTTIQLSYLPHPVTASYKHGLYYCCPQCYSTGTDRRYHGGKLSRQLSPMAVSYSILYIYWHGFNLMY